MPTDPIDEELEQSFPASDPPNWTGTHLGGPDLGVHDPQARDRVSRGEWIGSAAALRDRALAPGPLDAKTLELIAFAAEVAHGRASARAHAVAAHRHGASLEELRHALAVAAVAGGFGALDVGVEILNDVR
jgi:alkylhydroperoxidase/carboxymuconolactone decarboxylase family protein YurZ